MVFSRLSSIFLCSFISVIGRLIGDSLILAGGLVDFWEHAVKLVRAFPVTVLLSCSWPRTTRPFSKVGILWLGRTSIFRGRQPYALYLVALRASGSHHQPSHILVLDISPIISICDPVALLQYISEYLIIISIIVLFKVSYYKFNFILNNLIIRVFFLFINTFYKEHLCSL